MKTFLLFLFVVSAVFGKANDTLTRAQVYNFSIGDSFDYKYSALGFIGTPHTLYSESFKRQVIIDLYYSANSDTLFVVEKITDAYNGTYNQTVIISNLQDYEIYYANEFACMDTTYTTDSISQYNGRRVNESVCSGGLEAIYEVNRMVEGLGIVRKYKSYGNPLDGFFSSTMELMYYSKGTETWGTLQPVEIKDIRVQNNVVSLFPNPFSNQLTFSVADNEQTTVLLYNFLGKQVLQQTFTNSTTINTAHLADGIYFYELRNNNGALKTGKVVKQ
ncbi:MAG: T9SS type A sorting domain-containing protein [Chitinophagales bacterium]|nr:T9SS type A sorting domain-containing protein [Chitinophagales bacterium]